jgi:hypothetical protein
MKYQYFYQDKNNENHTGWIKARDRADAYTLLRKSGIKPYRVVGDDPVKWRPWAYGGVLGIAFLASLISISMLVNDSSDEIRPMPRAQIVGDEAIVEDGIAQGWTNVFSGKLDRYLAVYALPGRDVELPLTSAEEMENFKEELFTDIVYDPNDIPEHRQIKNIVSFLRMELRRHLEAGGTLGDYLRSLEERQQDEWAFNSKCKDRLLQTPDAFKYNVWRGLNSRLQERGMAPLPKPQGMIESL